MAPSRKKKVTLLVSANVCKETQLLSDKELKRFSFLFRSTDLFRHFVDPQIISQIDEYIQREKKDSEASKRKQAKKHHRNVASTDEDSPYLSPVPDEPAYFFESPSFIKGGEMRPYQVEGLNWLISLYHNNINGILADEMGLGKTLQTISLLGYLREFVQINGPHLLLVPKSTLNNWLNEFSKWLPSCNAFVLHGDAAERKELIKSILTPGKFDVCITSYEICLIEKGSLSKIDWSYLVIDEAHRIKNENSILSQIIRLFSTQHRLLLTGTPLQNNLHELWALLNFLLPDVFRSGEEFDEWFKEHEGEQEELVAKLRNLLQPFLLRRLKSDVEHTLLPKKEIFLYTGMTDLQRSWYQKILQKDLLVVNGIVDKSESKTRLMNIAMQLKKCCNHPYLFEGAEPGPPFTNDYHLVSSCGKMILLDKLLCKFKESGSRVLIFSQMSRMLDIFEDYCDFKNWNYCRIDGQTSHEDRIQAIDEYNRPGSEKFLFLLTTRAGGLGINLTSADVVILYDSDWNPQVDLQAQDRAHRIGQTKQVYVFRLVTEDSMEEKVLERALQKLRLDQLVIQRGKTPSANKSVTSNELLQMIHHGAQQVLDSSIGEKTDFDDSFDIESVLKTGEEKTQQLQQKYSKLGLDELQRFSTTTADETTGSVKRISPLLFPLELAKRERKPAAQYSVDSYYKETLSSGASKKSQLPPKPKLPTLHDFQFYDLPRLEELFEKETLYFQKSQEYQVPEDEEDQQRKQNAINNAEPLTADEEKEKDRLLEEGFGNWLKRDFLSFIRGCERHGRNASIELIGEEIEGKSKEEIGMYSKVFWSKYKKLANWQRYIGQIERGEQQLERAVKINKIIRKKVTRDVRKNGIDWSLVNLDTKLFDHFYASSGAGWFTVEEDKFILWSVAKYGYQTSVKEHLDSEESVWTRIQKDFRKEPFFCFDWFIHTRTEHEIQRRCGVIVTALEKEEQELAANAKKSSSPQRKASKSNGGKALDIDNLLNRSK